MSRIGANLLSLVVLVASVINQRRDNQSTDNIPSGSKKRERKHTVNPDITLSLQPINQVVQTFFCQFLPHRFCVRIRMVKVTFRVSDSSDICLKIKGRVSRFGGLDFPYRR